MISGNLTVKKLNDTNFLVSSGPEEIYQIMIENKSMFIVQEPFPDIDFADFRDNELYIKVGKLKKKIVQKELSLEIYFPNQECTTLAF